MKKHLLYLRYLLLHKWYVLEECFFFALEYSEPKLIWRGITHDLTKFLPGEWFPYVENFYGGYKKGERPRSVVRKFDRALMRHIHRNPHHWGYWIFPGMRKTGAIKKMPWLRVIEMVADWHAVGRVLKQPDTTVWYERNRSRMDLHPRTMYAAERILYRRPYKTL